MCGIAGIVSKNHDSFSSLKAMVAAIEHRGPDDEGLEYFEGAAFGHRRLSILDLAAGHQPMFNATRSTAIVFNGEIYNFPALKKQLEAEGRVFQTTCDTEAILHLYDKYEENCVRHLDGMFAFAIWDFNKKKLVMARDHIGQKPLFFSQLSNGLVFSSEVKSILASDLVSKQIDLEALYHYISLRFMPDRFTLFKNVQKLPAGHRLVFEKGQVSIEKYFSYFYQDKLEGSEKEITDQLENVLLGSVQEHLLSDVPVGSFLSGGIDSSLITAMMAKTMDTSFPTFSIGVKEQGFNELPYAKLVADQYNTEHHEQVVQADLVHLIPKMIWHLDEPSDPFGVGVYLVSQLAAEHVKVVLTGDGGDELFAGYDRFYGNRIIDYFCLLPKPLRRTLFKKVIDYLPEGYSYKSFSQKLRWLYEMSELKYGERYAQSMSFLRYTEEAKQQLFTSHAKNQLGEVNSKEKILAHFDANNATELVDRMLFTDMMTRIPDHLLMIVDRMAMAHGLEARPPMLEHKFVEFAAKVPTDLKLKGKNLKYILRQVASRYIHPSLITRKKQGFGFPLAYWMQTDLKHFLRNVVKESRFIQNDIFNYSYVNNLIEDHIGGKRDNNFRIWIFLNLEIWHRMYFENESIDSMREYIDRLVKNESVAHKQPQMTEELV